MCSLSLDIFGEGIAWSLSRNTPPQRLHFFGEDLVAHNLVIVEGTPCITTTAEPLDARDVLQERRKHSEQKKNLVYIYLPQFREQRYYTAVD